MHKLEPSYFSCYETSHTCNILIFPIPHEVICTLCLPIEATKTLHFHAWNVSSAVGFLALYSGCFFMLRAFLFSFTFVFVCFFSVHVADAVAGSAEPWQLGFQEPVTEIMEAIVKSHNFVMLVMSAVVIVVFVLLAYVLVKFRKRGDGPVEFNRKHSHNVTLEILWTLVPLVIVGFLTVSNVKLIKYEQQLPEADLVVKAIGYQWYWAYSYPENNISFESFMKPDSELKDGELRLLEVDNRVVVPVGKTILLQSTSADVIHSWAVPALGIKVDAVPGRLNEVWFSVKKPGVYYGQCSELCGRLHGFMPIVVEAVTQEEFDLWIARKKETEG